jgi:Bacterial Ig-like domain (group 3)
MNRAFLRTALSTGALLCPVFLASTAFPQSTDVVAQSAKPVISLEPSAAPNTAAGAALLRGEASFVNAPANFHSFPSAQVGENSNVEHLTLRFAASTKLTKIESTKDFKIEQGGSCVEESFFAAGDSCTLLVRFTPQGPGPRLGKVTIANTASPQAFSLGLAGNGYAPVVSFTPAVITTVPGTFPSGAGLLNGAKNLTVDGGDTLYIADTGNKVIRYMDSSGAIKTLATTATGPLGVAVDTFGEVYFDEPSANTMHEIYDYGPVVQVNGTGTASCPAATPCNFSSEALGTPGTMSMDAYNHLFFVDSHMGAAMGTMQPLPAKLIFLYDPFPYQTNPSSAIVADASDNIYSVWNNGGDCEIVQGSLYNAENSNVIFNKIVGGHTCGFSGDGGEAGNAEINAPIGQMAFDIAGNFYFSDTSNQRVRRIDAVTGLINTIAGSGAAGYGGDGSQATTATLSSPTGVAVDSQGQVYIISGAAATGTAQVIRKLGPDGRLTFYSQLKGTTSAVNKVTVSNTGNSAMTLTNAEIVGTNAADFKIDPTTTSCPLTPGSTLYSGQSCKVGILFTPSGGGGRSATLVFLDNTVNNQNNVELFGAGTLTPTFTITSPATGTSVKTGTAVVFSVSVTSTTSPAPTGTVKFWVDGVAIGSPVTLSSTGTASVSVTETTTGTHTLAASYNGNGIYLAAGPITRTYGVTATVAAPAPSKTNLVSSANPAVNCQPVAFSATVSGTSGTKPTGTVTLKKGATVLATATLSNGVAALSTAALPPGSNVLTASYGGDARYGASTSAEFTQVISLKSTCNILPRQLPVQVLPPSLPGKLPPPGLPVKLPSASF